MDEGSVGLQLQKAVILYLFTSMPHEKAFQNT
jgi:hypothetical protein